MGGSTRRREGRKCGAKGMLWGVYLTRKFWRGVELFYADLGSNMLKKKGLGMAFGLQP